MRGVLLHPSQTPISDSYSHEKVHHMSTSNSPKLISGNANKPLAEAIAKKEDLTPLGYMRKYGAFLVEEGVTRTHETPDENGVEINGVKVKGFPTPSKKLEFYSSTLLEWGWPEGKIPGYTKSHVHRDNIDFDKNEMLLLPTFRIPTLIHSRSGNAKWLYEISHRNPLWLHPVDAMRAA